MKVIFLVNSHIDKKGNFGVRVKKIIDFIERKSGIDFLCVSRGSGKSGSNFINLIFFGIFARFLNWYRLFVYRNFNHRKYERIIFERICLKVLKNKICPNSIVHLFEYSTKIIDYCNVNNIPVLIDVPNVTQNFIKEVHSSGKGHFLTYFSDQEKQEQLSLQKADKILSPSDFVTEYLIRLGIRKENISTPDDSSTLRKKSTRSPIRQQNSTAKVEDASFTDSNQVKKTRDTRRVSSSVRSSSKNQNGRYTVGTNKKKPRDNSSRFDD